MKKIAQRLLIVFVTLGLVVVLVQALQGSGLCGKYMTWQLSDSGGLYVQGYYDTDRMPIYSGRWNIDKYVTTAPWGVYWYNIKRAKFSGVPNISSNACLNCTSLTSVNISSAYTKIDADAFKGCTSITEIVYAGTKAQWDSHNANIVTGIPENATLRFKLADAISDVKVLNSCQLQFLVKKEYVLNGYSALISKTRADGTTIMEKIPFNNWLNYDDVWYQLTYKGINFKEVCDELSVEILDRNDVVVSNPWKGSIKDLAVSQMELATEKERNSYAAFLNYCAATQAFFNYNLDNVANKNIEIPQADIAAARKDGSSVTGNVVLGNSMVLDSDMTMRFYFNTGDITLTANGEAAELKAADGNSYCEIPVTDIFAEVEIAVQQDGKTVATAKDSAASYFARLYATGEEKAMALADAVILMGLLEK